MVDFYRVAGKAARGRVARPQRSVIAEGRGGRWQETPQRDKVESDAAAVGAAAGRMLGVVNPPIAVALIGGRDRGEETAVTDAVRHRFERDNHAPAAAIVGRLDSEAVRPAAGIATAFAVYAHRDYFGQLSGHQVDGPVTVDVTQDDGGAGT